MAAYSSNTYTGMNPYHCLIHPMKFIQPISHRPISIAIAYPYLLLKMLQDKTESLLARVGYLEHG